MTKRNARRVIGPQMGCGGARAPGETTDDVVRALANVADVHVDGDDRCHITGLAPDSSDDEYGGNTEPGSAWDEECDSRLKSVRDALPSGWTAEWSDDDVVITREAR